MYVYSRTLFWLTALFLFAGLALTFISHLHLCSVACQASLNYRIFGIPLDFAGFIFFPIAIASHFASRKSVYFGWLTLATLAGALGSEVWFIYLQKYEIGHWCPVCLSIATCVIIAFLLQLTARVKEWKNYNQQEKEVNNMYYKYGPLVTVFAAVIGFFIAFVGVSRINQLQAAEEGIKDKIEFGNKSSKLEVYLFTDWQCPACRKAEPTIEKLAPLIEQKAKFIFVDFPIHPETMNFTPYNLAFMVNNKDQYLKLRHILGQVSQETGSPTEEQIDKAISPLGVKYNQLNYSDIAVGFKYYKDLAKQFGIDMTPTVIIINTETKKGKKLKGGSEITETNIKNAIESLK